MELRTASAYATVYVVWGSTYLGIAIVVQTLPPLAAGSIRFLVAGILIALWGMTRPAGRVRPTAADWRHAFVTGGLMLALGNGILSVVQTRMPSGMAALVVGSVPIWMVLLEALHTRTAPRPVAWAGLALGTAGIAILATEDAGWRGGAEPLFVALLVVGSLAWALGSLYSRTSQVPSLRLRTGMQMLCGSAIMAAASLVRGEPVDAWRNVDATTLAALAYLVVFGSVAAFTAYIWLLRNEPAASVGTYAYVNPVVAVLLGAAVLDEPLTVRMLAAGALVVAAVVMINRARRTGDATAPTAAPGDTGPPGPRP